MPRTKWIHCIFNGSLSCGGWLIMEETAALATESSGSIKVSSRFSTATWRRPIIWKTIAHASAAGAKCDGVGVCGVADGGGVSAAREKDAVKPSAKPTSKQQ